MKRSGWIWGVVGVVGLVVAGMILLAHSGSATDADSPLAELQALPAPDTGTGEGAQGGMVFEQALASRRSIRRFKVGEDGRGAALSEAVLGQLLWSAQGITHAGRGLRATPSAGASYPLIAYAVTPTGVYRYEPDGHGIRLVREGDHRVALSQLSRGQPWIAQASASVVLVAEPKGIAARYGQHAGRYILLEAGHAAQNVLLQAVSLGLGGVPIGIHDDAALRELLKLSKEQEPVYYVSVGEVE